MATPGREQAEENEKELAEFPPLGSSLVAGATPHVAAPSSFSGSHFSAAAAGAARGGGAKRGVYTSPQHRGGAQDANSTS